MSGPVMNLSGTISASGGVVELPVPPGITSFDVFNPGASDLWLAWDTDPTIGGAGSFKLPGGAGFPVPAGATGRLKLKSTAASQPFTAYCYS